MIKEFQKNFISATSNEVLRLFHASKSGLKGPIDWRLSRPNCDFGRGFYLGDNEIQPKALVANKPDSFFYEMDLDLSGLKILKLDGLSWALTVASCRGKLDGGKHPLIFEHIRQQIMRADIISGPIADDEMFAVMKDFFKNLISWQAMLECMKGMDIGYQHVLKSGRACSNLRIVSGRRLEIDEKERFAAIRLKQKEGGMDFMDEKLAEMFGKGENMRQLFETLERQLKNAK